jgi:hypothetical protein
VVDDDFDENERYGYQIHEGRQWQAVQERESQPYSVTAWSTAARNVRVLAAIRLKLMNAQTKDFRSALV